MSDRLEQMASSNEMGRWKVEVDFDLDFTDAPGGESLRVAR